jgi:general secretion pathway protein G
MMRDENARIRRTLRVARGFTLLELLVVLGILAMLATVGAPQVLKYFGKAKSESAQIQLRHITSAVELYFLDNGRYPPQEVGLNALINAPPGATRWNGPYLKKAESLVDPWGRPYQYRMPAARGEFEVFSLGRDGAPGGNGEDRDVVGN